MGTTVVNGVTYVNSSGNVSFSDLRAAFGSSLTSFSLYKSRKFYKSDFSRGTTSSTIKFSDFRGASGSLPRVDRAAWPNAGKFVTSGSITLPRFNTLTIYAYAGGGGGGGGDGQNYYGGTTYTVVPGGAGGTGGTTTIVIPAGTFTATGGTGGNQGIAGVRGSPQDGVGAPGGAGNGAGGSGGLDISPTYNADTNYSVAQSIYLYTASPTYGAGGAGGKGGVGNFTSGTDGSVGTAGAITIFVDKDLY